MKLISAPMATISHPAFRIMIEKFGGCDEYYNEMINAPSLVNGGPFEKFYINPSPCPEKMVWQITGKDVSSIVKAALILSGLPGLGIDLNMGCCAPEIAKSGAGIAWMTKPISETEILVKEVGSALKSAESSCGKGKKRFSVKCRLGQDDFTDESFFSFTDMLVKNGVERISLHPRTQKEKYREKPRWIYAERLSRRYKNENVEVILNGDISDELSLSNAEEICPGSHGFMIGRAACQKPWIFARLKKLLPENPENIPFADELAFAFIDDVVKYQPEEFWKTRIHRFFSYYACNFSFAHYFRTLVLNAKTPDEAKEKVRGYFEKVKDDRILKIYK